MTESSVNMLICVTGIGAGDSQGHSGFFYDKIKHMHVDQEFYRMLMAEQFRATGIYYAAVRIFGNFFWLPMRLPLAIRWIYGPGDQDAVVEAIKSIAFTKIAFGVDPKPKDRVATMIRATEIRSKEFESHFDDIILS